MACEIFTRVAIKILGDNTAGKQMFVDDQFNSSWIEMLVGDLTWQDCQHRRIITIILAIGQMYCHLIGDLSSHEGSARSADDLFCPTARAMFTSTDCQAGRSITLDVLELDTFVSIVFSHTAQYSRKPPHAPSFRRVSAHNQPPTLYSDRAVGYNRRMKLIVQIPVLNEAESIGRVIGDIPRQIVGVTAVEILIIDDGCTDDTVAVARAHGADHVVHHTSRKGLAAAYQTGIDAALRLGADIIVNTDGDNQYPGAAIPQLIAPIVARHADMVIGDRQVANNQYFSPFKKVMQALGSSVVRWASDTDVPDTVSGFRALSREYALRTFVTSDFSYTVENLIQAGKRRLTVATIPITTNHVERKSRLHRGNWNFIKRQAATIARSYISYEPLRTFSYLAAPFLLIGTLLMARAVYVFIGRNFGVVASNDQALIGGGVALILGFIIFLIGLLADRVGGNRRVADEILYRVRRQEVAQAAEQRALDARLTRIEQSLGLLIERDASVHPPTSRP